MLYMYLPLKKLSLQICVMHLCICYKIIKKKKIIIIL